MQADLPRMREAEECKAAAAAAKEQADLARICEAEERKAAAAVAKNKLILLAFVRKRCCFGAHARRA